MSESFRHIRLALHKRATYQKKNFIGGAKRGKKKFIAVNSGVDPPFSSHKKILLNDISGFPKQPNHFPLFSLCFKIPSKVFLWQRSIFGFSFQTNVVFFFFWFFIFEWWLYFFVFVMGRISTKNIGWLQENHSQLKARGKRRCLHHPRNFLDSPLAKKKRKKSKNAYSPLKKIPFPKEKIPTPTTKTYHILRTRTFQRYHQYIY